MARLVSTSARRVGVGGRVNGGPWRQARETELGIVREERGGGSGEREGGAKERGKYLVGEADEAEGTWPYPLGAASTRGRRAGSARTAGVPRSASPVARWKATEGELGRAGSVRWAETQGVRGGLFSFFYIFLMLFCF